ncbi:MAG: hypothetical protein ACRDRI_18165 [Pseudonocardiaceae bacterium]
MNPVYLPPQPDCATGQPRPPSAPTKFPSPERTPREREPRKHPPIPDERGPALEWCQDSTTWAIISGLIFAGIIISVYTAHEHGFGWVTIWWVWLLPIIFGLAVYWGMSKNWLAAGATWLQNGDVWVDVYELVSIDIKAGGAKLNLRLTDSAGRTIGALSLADAQRNHALWDLVYNGILHSVANGKADPPTNVRTILKLPGGRGQHRDGS